MDATATITPVEILTVAEYAGRLKVSRATVFGWIRNRTLQEGTHFFRLGGVLRFIWRVDQFIRPLPEKRVNDRGDPPRIHNRKPSGPKTGPAVNLDY